MIEWVHPGILLILGAALVPFLRGTARKTYLVFLAALALVDCLAMSPGRYWVIGFLDYDLVFGRVDRLSLVFSYVFTLVALIGVIYSLHVREGGQHAAALVYAGSALGAVFAGDFFVLFVFWELMGLSSVFLVWYGKNRRSLAAGFRYLLVHTFGGACLLAGIIIHVNQTGSIVFENLAAASGGTAFYLIMIGFILNAAVPPLSAWLTDAYPEATVTGAVFMSAFTTKTAVYALVRGFPGTEALVWLGAVMALYGVIYAVLQNDARRLLAYHIVSQVGYMVAGVGLGTDMAINGSVSHAFAHILYKALLFMGAGAVIHVTGKRKLSEMGGLYRKMPLTLTLYMVGAFSISALPLTSGFISKSMVVTGAAEALRPIVFLMLTAASAGTFLSVGLKLPYFMFFGKESGLEAAEPPRNMLAGMGIAAFLCIFIGIFPQSLYFALPRPVLFSPYTAQHVVTTMEILLFTALGFMAMKKYLVPKPSTTLDTDWFYRKGAQALMWLLCGPVSRFEFGFLEGLHTRIMRPVIKASPLFMTADNLVIDGAVNGVGRGALALGRAMRAIQNGSFHRYAYVMVIGLVMMISLALILF